VEPPIATWSATAFSNDFFERMSEGRRSLATASMTASPDRRATSYLASDSAGASAVPSGASPSASEIDAIVFAVNIPPQEPAPGHAWRSRSSSSSALISPCA